MVRRRRRRRPARQDRRRRGDGAVGLLAVLAAKQLGAERIIPMSRHPERQKLALEYGATDIVTERGDDGVTRIKDLTDGYGAHSVIEAVGTRSR
jgi:threonine dehydrogenase-like Zn-dependent dehydrogenase